VLAPDQCGFGESDRSGAVRRSRVRILEAERYGLLSSLQTFNGVTIKKKRGEDMPTASSSISWTHDLESALARARAGHLHILLDFTAAPM
jgi:hypothetical protein